MTVFSCNNLSKTYSDNLLFDDVSFGMEYGERIGIIGKNGIGKTTLMKIIAGLDSPDTGEVVFNNKVKYEYLEQLPEYETGGIALDEVMRSQIYIHDLLEEHRRICKLLETHFDKELSDKLEATTHKLDVADGWNLENEAKKILSMLGVEDFFAEIKTMSGGMRKRVALARALLSEPELLILDEPTNHLDADSVQWLQDRLQNSSNSLIFVTHDRYFLDAVATKIIEIDQKRIFSYPGSYESYLERKEAFTAAQQSSLEHLLTRLRTELAWLQKGAKARRRKQKSRIDWALELEKSAQTVKEKKIKIELGKSFLGSRIIDAHNITKSISGKMLFENFTYIAKPRDRIGIIGPNGSGKSTLLSVLASEISADSGTVKQGASAKIGFFRQEITDIKDTQSVISVLRDVAEYIDVGIGRDRYLSCRDLLDKFLFPRNRQSTLVGTLSGGERRRLALLRVLMANPNVLLLDEPTNDFDLQTLSAFEEYLDDFYGVLIIVSHDRAFLDRTVDFIYQFDGKGNIKQFPGNYSAYLEKKEALTKRLQEQNENSSGEKYQKPKGEQIKKKLSFMEKREYDELTARIEVLEQNINLLKRELSDGLNTDYKVLQSKSEELINLESELDSAMARWLELEESIEIV